MILRIRIVAAVVILGGLLSACTLQTNTVLEATGAGELRTEIGLTVADQQILRTIASSPEQFCRDMQANDMLPSGAAVSVEKRGLDVWCILSLPFDNVAELEELYAEMQGVTVNQIGVSEDVFTYDVHVEVLGSLLSEFGAVVPDIHWQVTMPGRVLVHNADQASGRTLTWDMVTDERIHALATSEMSSGGVIGGLPALSRSAWIVGALLAFCLCGGLMGALGAGTFFLVRRRKQSQAALAPG